MVRTQIQLTEKQTKMLRSLAKAKKVSMAELIRQGVELLLRNSSLLDVEETKKKAIQAVGKFSSGTRDISEKHDKYLDEAFSHEGIR
jgi:Arc/MetJ-type ribon-helix-helix transcriptional regulator